MNNERIDGAVRKLRRIINEEGLNLHQGLTEDLFIFASTLMPLVNIDLFIMDYAGRLLLSWRSDPHFGRGWHIPGGCVRIRETLDERIQKTAIKELGCRVYYEPKPIVVKEAILKQERPWLSDELERSHNISFLYRAKLPVGYEIDNGNRSENDEGYLRWFEKIPAKLLVAHQELYMDILKDWERNR